MTTDCDRTESREADEIANVVSSHARIHEGAVMVAPVNAAAAGCTRHVLQSKLECRSPFTASLRISFAADMPVSLAPTPSRSGVDITEDSRSSTKAAAAVEDLEGEEENDAVAAAAAAARGVCT